MKRFLNSLLKLCCFVALIQMLIIGAAFSPSHQIAAQRLTRPPNREQQGQEEEADQPEKSAKTEAGATANSGERLTRAPIDPAKAAVLPAGSNSIPEGTKLIVELETRLSSKESRPGDLFTARISTPILDEDGRTILPADAVIEGSVVDAQPAKRPRRSGVLQLAFENLRLGDDAVVPIRGKLTNAEDEDRNRFDDEGNIKSPASHKGALTITGAGAGAGIAIGAVAGGAIAGAGVGAVAGLTVALLMKGRDVIIEPGHRFGLELIQPLSLNAETPAAPARTTIRTATVRNRPTSNSKANPKDKADSTANPLSTSASTSAHDDNTVAVDLSEVRSERTPDGVLLILLTAKTPGAGWRIMADHVVAGDQVEVELRGVPPATPASNRVSHPTAPTIRIPDHDAAIKRIVVRAKNGVREAKIGAYPGGSRPVLIRRTKPAAAPETEKPAGASGASTNSSATSSSSTTVSGPGIEAEIAKLRTDFGSEVGIQINQDGAYEPTGAHNLTPDEEQLLDALGSQLNAVRTYNRNSAKSAARRKNALLVEEDRKLTGQIWQRVKMNREMNQRFRAMLQNTQTLVANDLGEPLKSKAPASSPPQPAPNNSSIPAGPATAPPENSSTSSTLSGASLDDFAGTVIGEIELCQYDFGGVVGAWINPDGTYDLNGDRKLTADEKQMLDQLAAMLKSAKTLSGPAAKVDRGNVGKFRSETAKVGQSWKRVKMDAELNQKFSKMLQDARALADMASR